MGCFSASVAIVNDEAFIQDEFNFVETTSSNLPVSFNWFEANAYATTKGSRLATKAELQEYFRLRNNQALYLTEIWVAVSDPVLTEDWI